MSPLIQLQAIASQCIKTRGLGECDQACGGCSYNVFQYTDVKDGTLLLAEARAKEADYQRVKQQQDTDNFVNTMGPLVAIAIIVGLIAWGCSACGI